MNDDIKYIIKRVIVGVVLFITIYFLKEYFFLNVLAETLQPTSACVIGGQQNSVCGSPPVYDGYTTSYGTAGYNVWFLKSGMLQTGGTYYVTFSAYLQGNNSITDLSNMSLFTGNNGNANLSATPDRNEQFNFYQVSANTYRVIWSFELDSYSNYDTLRFSFSNSNVIGYNGQPLGIISTTLDISSNGGGSGGNNSDIIINNNDNTQDIINNNNQNTQDIINNNNQNTTNIINNNNQIAENQHKDQLVCKTINKDDIVTNHYYLNNSGSEVYTNADFGISAYIKISSTSSVLSTNQGFSGGTHACFYDSNKNKISCFTNGSALDSITIPSNANYIRTSINGLDSRPLLNICTNGNQALTDSLTDDNIDKNTGNDFFDNFNYGDDTLSGVITAPLRFFNKLTDTCSPLTLTLFSQNISLPCGDTVFWGKSEVSTFRNWWNIFFGGIAIYALTLKAYKVIHDSIDPEKDNIESVGV